MHFTPRQLALHAARLASDKGADDIVVLQLPAIAGTPFEYVVLATARSDRQTNAVVEELYHFCKRHNVARMPVEGESGWMLIDCFDVVLHALTSDMRTRYDLDHLWPLAKSVTKWEAESKALPDPERPAPVEPVEAPAAKKTPKRRRAAARAPESESDALVEAGVLPPNFDQPKPKRKRAVPKRPAAQKGPAAKRASPTAASKPVAKRKVAAKPAAKPAAKSAAKPAAKPAANSPAKNPAKPRKAR